MNANMTSPVQKYNINSGISSPKDEGFGIKMVDSKIEPSSSTVKSPTYGSLTDSKQSGASSASKEPQGSTYGVNVNQVTSAYQTPASSYQSSSVSGSSGVYGTSLSGSGVQYQQYQTTSNVQNIPTYQQGSSSGVYQGTAYTAGSPPAYQAGTTGAVGFSGTGSGVYQSGTGSGVYQSGASSGSSAVYQAGSSGVYQAGTYQPGSSGVYQSGTYQPYQSGTYQSSTYRPSTGTTGATGATGATGTTGTTSTSQYTSSYRYEKK